MRRILLFFLLFFPLIAAGEPEEVRLAAEARRVLSEPEQHAGFGVGTKPVRGFTFNVRLAVKRDGESFRTILISKDCVPEEGWVVSCGRNGSGELNGVNTPYSVKEPAGYKVYALRRVVGAKGGSPREVVYTPFIHEIATPEVKAHGRNYLRSLISLALTDLRMYEVRSRAGDIFVADHVTVDFLEKLAVIEHIDHDRFAVEKMEDLAGEVYAILAFNREDAYIYAVSRAGARGLFQFMPETYKMLLKKYSEARLEKDFVRGTANPLNSIKKTVLLTDYHISLLPPDLRGTILALPTFYEEYGGASHNGGPGRAIKLLRLGKDLEKENPNNENRIFVAKLRALRDLLNPVRF